MKPEISVVTTIFNNSDHLDEFIVRVEKVFRDTGREYEIVIIDDGSDEKFIEKAWQAVRNRQEIVFRRFSRNFGHHKALIAGMELARGEIVCLIDSDLEEAPEDLAKLLDEYNRSNADVVYGFQNKRVGNPFEKFSGWVFYTFMRQMGVRIPRNFMTIRVMSHQYVKSFLLHGEYVVNLSALLSETGFYQKGVALQKVKKRKSSYNFASKVNIVINAITSHSVQPLISIYKLGLIFFVTSLLVTIALAINWIYSSTTLSGWTSLILSIWMLGGLILISLGIIGLYLSNVFLESKQRPRYIFRNSNPE